MTLPSTYIISLLYFLVCCEETTQTDVSLRISPDRSQFFKHESLSLHCEDEQSTTLVWSVKRETRERANGTCNVEWGVIKGGSCFVQVLFSWDSGLYWCQARSGELSRSINITISDGDVILEIPVLPVMEGSNVTLHCWSKDKAKKMSSDLPADFYKDGSLISASSTGQLTIPAVHVSDGGLYKCNISDLGESPESWLDVRGTGGKDSTSSTHDTLSLAHLIVHLLMSIPYMVSTILCIRAMRPRGRAAANDRREDINDVMMEVAV